MKKNRFLTFIFYLLVFGVFLYFENNLYQKYIADKKIRDYIKEKNTEEIKNSFLLRKKYFYLDKDYLNKHQKLVNEASKKGKE
ncbi:hypothetical protein [uncultured Fusobacterium sp.]|uniref:hypothetical protein n=1 Tax=uncultured Fusobacterium sp. TaxID=159267 RepID=UPI0025D77B08|nr:hypothetical protein [uncultured Fusobacterium sp.]